MIKMRIGLIAVILLCWNQYCYGIACHPTGSGDWSAVTWVPSPPGNGDSVEIIVGAVDLDAPVIVDQITLIGGTLDAGSYTITLSNTYPFFLGGGGTFIAGTGTVKLTDADHTIVNDYTYNNLIIDTLTAPRTITIGGFGLSISMTVNGTFISGSSVSKQVSFVKGVVPPATVNVTTPVTSLYCADNGGITNITCLPGGAMPAAPTGLSVVAVTPTSVELAWTDNSTNETSFNVKNETSGSSVDRPGASTGTGTASTIFSVLGCSQTYTFTVRANNDGTLSTLSNSVTATTSACPVTAGVTLNSVSNITGSTVLATGTATGTGIGERGFFWWNDEQYWGDHASGLIPAGYGAGDFSLNLTNLPLQTQLYVSAYVKVGGQLITSDNKISITTTGPVLPTVITKPDFTVNGNSVSVKGVITDVGSNPVNVYGFVYAEHKAPTNWDEPALPFTRNPPTYETGAFEGTIPNLSPGTYYFRAYAHNTNPDSDPKTQPESLSYGEEFSFTIGGSTGSDIPGDLNGDGKVDLQDVIIALKILDNLPVENLNLKADVNGDGKIGHEEAIFVLQKVSMLRN